MSGLDSMRVLFCLLLLARVPYSIAQIRELNRLSRKRKQMMQDAERHRVEGTRP